jgi:hypothetical protein
MEKISIKEVTSLGPIDLLLDPEEALDLIKTKTSQNAMWVYLDGNNKNPDDLTVEDLINIQGVTLTSKILGGDG